MNRLQWRHQAHHTGVGIRGGRVLAAALVVAIDPWPVGGHAETPEPTALEYKLRLAVEMAAANRERRFWDLVVGAYRDDCRRIEVKTKKCQLVS